jgi:hypothetical protein
MNTTEPTGFMGAISRLLTLKTSQQLYVENAVATQKVNILNTPRGINSAIDIQQQALDKQRAESTQFLTEIENHFGQGKKFLGEDYTGKSTLEKSGAGYKFGMKWTHITKDSRKVEIGFVYMSDYDDGIRVDYVMTNAPQFDDGGFEVVNDKFFENGNTHKVLWKSEDTFRSVRRFQTHDEFLTGPTPPEWFLDMLAKNADRVPPPPDARVRT